MGALLGAVDWVRDRANCLVPRPDAVPISRGRSRSFDGTKVKEAQPLGMGRGLSLRFITPVPKTAQQEVEHAGWGFGFGSFARIEGTDSTF